ncbi:unnamed protein product [Mesocestoides corti]|uniref:Uncharacterized protein n=1 Tax=Mesocestoides corti TaxID=53468 RepID=A0A0R3UJW1_MESCO|nr:unnamed protein product [Mesocestoides corti]
MLNLFSKSTGRHYSNKFEYSSNPRRLSVTPSGKTFRRHTYEGGSACADASGTSITSKGLDRLSSFLGIKRKESFQPEYFELLEKHEALERELREIWGLIEYLQRVYEFSKTLDPVTRYRRLKASVKRTSMFLQVFAIQSSLADDLGVYYTSVCTGEYDRSFQNAIQQGSVVGSSAKEAEAFRQREEAFSRTSYDSKFANYAGQLVHNGVGDLVSHVIVYRQVSETPHPLVAFSSFPVHAFPKAVQTSQPTFTAYWW